MVKVEYAAVEFDPFQRRGGHKWRGQWPSTRHWQRRYSRYHPILAGLSPPQMDHDWHHRGDAARWYRADIDGDAKI